MKLENIAIKNRRNMTMYVHYVPAENAHGLSIIQHGYSGGMDEDHIQAIGKTYGEQGFNVLYIDATNSFNDSDGTVEENSIETHLHDLEDAIEWAASQQWYQEPFALTGHSLGGFSVLLYAGQNPEKISMLFPAAAVLSGNHLENAYKTHMPDYYDEYIKNGSSVVECSFKPGLTAIKPLSWLTDMREWDAAPLLKNLTMPVLLVVGEHDEPTPPEHQQEIYDGLATNNKTLHIIAGADHCYNPAPGQDKLTAILGDWLGKNKTSVTSQTNDQQKTAYKSRRRPSETAALYCSDRTANGREYRHDGTGNAELRCNGTAPCQPA